MNLYQYVGSNPVNRLDALGLEWGMEDEIDDLIADRTGQALYALGALNEGAKMVALGLNTALDIAGSLLGLDVFQSVAVLASGKGGFWEGMDIALAMVPGGSGAKALGILAKAHKFRSATRTLKTMVHSVDDLLKFTARWKRGYNPAKLTEAAAKYPHFVGKEEWHHIIPKYVGGPTNGPTVRVKKEYHQLLTNKFREVWKYKNPRGKPTPAELEEILDEVYSELPIP
jgi:hypothetical protein